MRRPEAAPLTAPRRWLWLPTLNAVRDTLNNVRRTLNSAELTLNATGRTLFSTADP